MDYLHDDVFLTTATSRWLYHEVAKNQPIIDFHTHLPQDEVLDDHRFENLWELWLKYDHYKWRLMRASGVDEKFISGTASPWEKFHAFASIMPLALGNPVHQWAHFELKRVFGINTLLSANTAKEIWLQANDKLQNDPKLSVRGLLEFFNVETICTTDDPASDLSSHLKLQGVGKCKVLPTFRPDLAMKTDEPEKFTNWINQLAQRIGSQIDSYQALIAALKLRHDEFHQAGCRLSDHGPPFSPTEPASDEQLEAIFQKVVAGSATNELEWDQFAFAIMANTARWNHEKNWTMQLHLGPLRNTNSKLFQQVGPDAGFDTMGNWQQTTKLINFLDQLNNNDQLPRVIVYNLNPNESSSICCALQSFQDASCPGKLQYGPAWWHLDYKKGMLEQLDLFSSYGALGTFVGMLTDSRSFTSYVRHEYFRRLLCQYLGQAAELGEIPADKQELSQLVSNICYNNSKNYFHW